MIYVIMNFGEFCEVTGLDKQLGKDIPYQIYDLVTDVRKVYIIKFFNITDPFCVIRVLVKDRWEIPDVINRESFGSYKWKNTKERYLDKGQIFIEKPYPQSKLSYLKPNKTDYMNNKIVRLKDRRDKRKYKELVEEIKKADDNLNRLIESLEEIGESTFP